MYYKHSLRYNGTPMTNTKNYIIEKIKDVYKQSSRFIIATIGIGILVLFTIIVLSFDFLINIYICGQCRLSDADLLQTGEPH